MDSEWVKFVERVHTNAYFGNFSVSVYQRLKKLLQTLKTTCVMSLPDQTHKNAFNQLISQTSEKIPILKCWRCVDTLSVVIILLFLDVPDPPYAPCLQAFTSVTISFYLPFYWLLRTLGQKPHIRKIQLILYSNHSRTEKNTLYNQRDMSFSKFVWVPSRFFYELEQIFKYRTKL